jgi:hypothetical protein
LKIKKSLSIIMSVVLVMACMFTALTASAEVAITRANVYIRTDNNPVPYDHIASNYDMKIQTYLTVAEELFNTDGISADHFKDNKLPSVVLGEGESVLWYEVVNDGGNWRVHGVIVEDEIEEPEVPDETVASITRANVYIRTDNNPVPYDNDASNYDMKKQAYLTVAEELFNTDGILADHFKDNKLPSVVLGKGESVLWYEVVNDGGNWRVHGIIVKDEAEDPEVPDETVSAQVKLGIITPKKMSIRFEDGKIYNSGDYLKLEIGKTYAFQMCSNNWDNDKYDDNGNGLRGTVVYHVKVSNSFSERSYDENTHTFVLPKGDPNLRTDINSCFMAYRYHFIKGDYNKQTGIKNVINKPLESLSVNLPLGSTVKSDAYIGYKQVTSENVFIERVKDRSLSYADYYWNY